MVVAGEVCIWSALHPKNGLTRTAFPPPTALPARAAGFPSLAVAPLHPSPVPSYDVMDGVSTLASDSIILDSDPAAPTALAASHHHLGQHIVLIVVEESRTNVTKPMTLCEGGGLPS